MLLSRFFGKSKPIVYLILVCYISIHFWVSVFLSSTQLSLADVCKYSLVLLLFFGINFIVKRNNITKKNAFSALFFTLLCTAFPEFYLDFNCLIPAVFVVLGLRRLISLKTQLDPKKKIFDASLWFFVACLFQPFLLPLILLVFLGVIRYTLYDAKNLIIPFVAWICGALFFTAFQLWKTDGWVFFYESYALFGWNDFNLIWQMHKVSISILIPLILFILFGVNKIIKKAQLSLKTSLILVVLTFVFGLMGWMFSAQNHVASLGITFIPLSMLAATSLEIKMKPIVKEVFVWLFFLVSLIALF